MSAAFWQICISVFGLVCLVSCASTEEISDDDFDGHVARDAQAARHDASTDATTLMEEDAAPAAEDLGLGERDAFIADATTMSDASVVLPDAAFDAEPMPDAFVPGDDPCEGVPDCDPRLPLRQPPGLPRIHDLSGVPPAHVDDLVRRALDGLGLDAETGPAPLDRVFVGQWYIAWIDETGFYGKINGLWTLNGDLGALDFVLLDGDRPVNTFIVGEHGEGRWPGGYMGSEHIEFPNGTPEPDDDRDCADEGRFCAQYSHGEAHRYTDPDIPAWRACNDGSPSWDTHFSPYEIALTDDGRGIRLMYEGPLTKQGDFGGSSRGRNCHDDFLFPDGMRRRVYLRTGYTLSADGHAFDRLVQVRNPAGNPRFDGPFSFIGGFVMTDWPNAHPLKGLHRYGRVDQRQVSFRWGDGEATLPRGQWAALPGGVPDHDVILAWAGQPISLSAFPGYTAGRAFTLSHVGPEDNDDTGICLCVVHGAIEMGGGLIHNGVEGGTLSFVARRRLTLHHEEPPPQPRTWVYEAESDLQRPFGRAEADGWSASTALDDEGHMLFGPYAQDWGTEPRTARFELMVDVANARDEVVVTLDVYDADTGEVLAQRDVPRSAFPGDFEYVGFELDFDMAGRDGHRMETRVYWHDISYVRVDRVVVSEGE
ncbi:MAG: hypothetical protein ACE366_24635 [Bradymonadia bacterium]